MFWAIAKVGSVHCLEIGRRGLGGHCGARSELGRWQAERQGNCLALDGGNGMILINIDDAIGLVRIDFDSQPLVLYGGDVYLSIPKDEAEYQGMIDQIAHDQVKVLQDSGFVYVPMDWVKKSCPSEDRDFYGKLETQLRSLYADILVMSPYAQETEA